MSARNASERAAHARWAARRRRLISYGQWQPFIDSQPVRDHVRALQAEGMPVTAVAEKLGMPRDGLRYLLWGAGDHGPSAQTRRETAEAVLAYWPKLADFPDSARICPVGTRRRLEALAVQGWPRSYLADRLGIRHASFNRSVLGPRVTARIARAVAALYDEMWKRQPEDYGVPRFIAVRTRRHAAAAGWVSPLGWDDESIDDPTATPVLDAETPAPAGVGENAAHRWLLGEAVILDAVARREVIAHLMEWSELTAGQVGERLDMSEDAVSRSWERVKERARKAGEPVPWRRAYVPVRETQALAA